MEGEGERVETTHSTSFWVAIAEAIAIVGAAVEETIRNCCKKRQGGGEGAEITVEIAEQRGAEKK